MRHKKATRAFTLVELLVVISIIVVLLSLLTPAMEQAMDQAQTARCMANMDGLGTAMAMYHIENNYYYPGHHGTGDSFWRIWPVRLRKYAGESEKLFNCPSADPASHWNPRYDGNTSGATVYGYRPGEVPLNPWLDRFTYGYNDWGHAEFHNPHLGLGGHVGEEGHGELKTSAVEVPGDMVALGDSTDDGSWDGALDPKNSQADQHPGFRHLGRKVAVILFADKHVEQVGREIIDAADNRQRSRWNNDHLPHTGFN